MKKLLFILLAAASVNAYSYCAGRYFPDTGICQIQGNNGEIINYNSGTPNGNSSSPPPRTEIIRIPDKWGAISFNKSNGYLYSSINFSSKRSAQKSAIAQCEKERNADGSCNVIATFRNTCAATAGGNTQKGRVVFPGTDVTPSGSEQAALASCKESGGTNCVIEVSAQCSLPD